MKKINLINSERSEVKYTLTVFPDGEPHIKLEDIDRKDEYSVICRISNPSDLFVVMQVGNILKRQGVLFDLHIRYLMGMRMDRVISFNEAFSLEIVAGCINSLEARKVYVFEAHSDRTFQLIRNSEPDSPFMPLYIDTKNKTCCYPDKGSIERYYGGLIPDDFDAIVMDKRRDLSTGRIQSLDIIYEPSEIKDTIIIIDDLCDAGGTFVWAAKILRERYPDKKIFLSVKHLVNEVGYKNITEAFDFVSVTNSYKDWEDNDKISVIYID